MIVFRQPARVVDPAQVFSRTGSPLSFLLEFGEIEAALADRACPDGDGLSPEIERLRAVSVAAARRVIQCAAAVEIEPVPLPREPLTVSVPEGYAYYGLDPRAYMRAARRFAKDARPAEVAVIGIRSIGTSLGALVSAALEEAGARVHSFTVRPHGHPFDRCLKIEPALERRWRALPHAHFVVVDEGPGLSGSSFAAVARKLSELGIQDARIVLFPSWLPDGSEFVSQRAAQQWSRHTKYCDEPESQAGVDISAGRWRSLVYASEDEYPFVAPRHEARKFLDGGRLAKFEGLGPYGEARFDRARQLAEAGFCPRVFHLDNGFIHSEFLPGRPLTASTRSPELIETLGRYLAFRARETTATTVTPIDELANMIEVNCGAAPSRPPEIERPAIPDARMLPHEWLETAQGYFKTDAIDHGDNHFYPGPTDIAWDLAGAIREFQFGREEARYLVDRYIVHSGDRNAPARLPFFLAAYGAFRSGYRKMYDH